MSVTSWVLARSCPRRSSSFWVSGYSGHDRAGDDAERSDEEERRHDRAGDDAQRSDEEERRHDRAGDDAERSDEEERRHDRDEVSVSQDPPDRAGDEIRDAPSLQGPSEADSETHESAQHGRHELPARRSRPEIGAVRRTGLSGLLRGGRSRLAFGTLAIVLCLVLGIAIVSQVRQTRSGDSLDTARPADLLVLLDSLRQREATLNTEVSELQNTLNSLQASGNSDQAAIQSAQARLAALSILVGAVGATGPGVTVTIDDPGPGVSPETMLDVINELRAAGAEALEINDAHQSVRVGVDTWVVGSPGSLTIDSKTLSPPYSVLAIGDPPTLAAAMNIPGGAEDSIKRVGGRMSVQQANRVDVTTLRQPKPHQYAQPGK